MPMTAASMKSKIEAAIVAAGGSVSEGGSNQLAALCAGIIGEIQANAQVAPGIAVATSTGSGATTSPGTIS